MPRGASMTRRQTVDIGAVGVCSMREHDGSATGRITEEVARAIGGRPDGWYTVASVPSEVHMEVRVLATLLLNRPAADGRPHR